MDNITLDPTYILQNLPVFLLHTPSIYCKTCEFSYFIPHLYTAKLASFLEQNAQIRIGD